MEVLLCNEENVLYKLGIIEGKIDAYATSQDHLREYLQNELEEVYSRINTLEIDDATGKGFVRGAKWSWGTILSVPIGIAAFILGKAVELPW